MVTAFPVRESEPTAEALLRLLLENSHIDEDGIFSVPLEAWKIDLLSDTLVTLKEVDFSDDDKDEWISRNRTTLELVSDD